MFIAWGYFKIVINNERLRMNYHISIIFLFCGAFLYCKTTYCVSMGEKNRYLSLFQVFQGQHTWENNCWGPWQQLRVSILLSTIWPRVGFGLTNHPELYSTQNQGLDVPFWITSPLLQYSASFSFNSHG